MTYLQSAANQKRKTVTMESQSVSRASMYRRDQWQSLVGEIVEVRLDGEVYRKGSIDAAMPDASGLWIAPEGAFQREFIDAASGFGIWTSLSAFKVGRGRRFRDGQRQPKSVNRSHPGQEMLGGLLHP